MKKPITFLQRVWPAAAYQSCFVGSLALLKPGANAVVISRYGATSLPFLYLLSAAITAALAAANVLYPQRRLMPVTVAVVGAMFAALSAVGLTLAWPVVPLFSYVFAEVFGTAAAISLWSVLADAFDAREARRAFTVINGVGMLGAVVGGLSAQVLAHLLGAPALLAAGAVMLLGGSVAFRFHRSDLAPVVPVVKPKGEPVWRQVIEPGYPRMLGLTVLGFSVLSVLSDFFFRARAGQQLSEADMASIFGSVQLWTGLFSAVFQLALAELLLRRLGVVRYLLLMPTIWALLALVAVVVPSVWSTYALKLFESSAMFSLLPVGVQLLYAALPDDTRDGIRSAIDGFLRKGGLLVVGMMLAGIAPFISVAPVGVTVVLLALALAGLLIQMRPKYLEMLQSKVAGKDATRLDTVDDATLGQALRTPDPERALRALDLLVATGASVVPHLRTLLTHPHERVRERGVHLSEKHLAVKEASVIEGLIYGTDRRPRDAAVLALSVLLPARAKEVLPPLLSVEDIGLKTSAIGALLSIEPDHPSAKVALAELLQHGAAAPAAERREVARLLGRLKNEQYAPALARAMDDAESSVRRVAIRAAGSGGYTSLAPRLLRFLSWRDERRTAREALEMFGDAVVPLVAAALDDRSRSLSLRYQLPRVLREIGTQSALDALLFSNAHDDAFLHYRVGVALSRLKDERPELQIDTEQVLGALARRRELYREMIAPWQVLMSSMGQSSLVVRSLGDRLDQAFELTFLLLGLLHGDRMMRRVHAQLRSNDVRSRAWARELLDNLLPPDERALVAQQIEQHHRYVRPGDPSRAVFELGMLCNSEDGVLRAVARHVARQADQWDEAYREDDMSEATVRRLFQLEGVEIFAESDVDDLAAIAAVAKESSFRKGERVYAEGDPGDAVFVVIEGSAESRRSGEVVMQTRVREAFGEVSLFDGAPRVTEVVATEDLKVLSIDRRDFLDLISDRPELLAGVFRVLSRQLKSVLVELASRKTTGEMMAAVVPSVPLPPPVPEGR